MAHTPIQRRSSIVWLWIILGVIALIAAIWWAMGTGTIVAPPVPDPAAETPVKAVP